MEVSALYHYPVKSLGGEQVNEFKLEPWTGHTTGNYTVSVTATWTGTAEYYYNDRLLSTVDLGTYQYTDSADQNLHEIEVLNR